MLNPSGRKAQLYTRFGCVAISDGSWPEGRTPAWHQIECQASVSGDATLSLRCLRQLPFGVLAAGPDLRIGSSLQV